MAAMHSVKKTLKVLVGTCASTAALSGQSRMMLDPQKKYTSVNLSMPRERVIPVLEKLYGKKLSGQQVKAASTGVSASVAIHLKNANLNAVLQELGKNTEIEKSTDTPKIIERELTPDTGEYMRTPCYKTERYCTEWLPDGKCKLWDSRQVQAPC
ncbi:MAG: hypothetical protein A3K04_03465 [Gallionellales bacterium RBG_16_56_9]|nr:MAG: hypothetical protein A3K04_03465 [Gallionellales bacterium RBG_16_56_9]